MEMELLERGLDLCGDQHKKKKLPFLILGFRICNQNQITKIL